MSKFMKIFASACCLYLLANLGWANSAPTDINASNLSIAENSSIGTVIGEFNATDPDGHAITYSLVPFSPVYLSPALWLDASDEATLVKESGALSACWTRVETIGTEVQPVLQGLQFPQATMETP